MNNAPILVIGSTGKTGRRVATMLKAKGHDVREGSRRAPLPFDWDDRGTWREAAKGTKAAYITYSPDLAAPGALDNLSAFIEIAREENIERLVLLSGRGEANAKLGEQAVLQSGIPATVVRAAWFNQNFTEGHLVGAIADGVLALPAGDIKEAFVDVDDIAEVAVAALTEDGHAGEVYEVTGPELLSFTEAAQMLTEASGRPVQYQPITFDQARTGLVAQVGPDLGNIIADIMTETLNGSNQFVADGVQRALGREPKSFKAFTDEAKQTGAWDALLSAANGDA